MRAVIIDIDGTVACVDNRVHHLDGEKDWSLFFKDMQDDEAIEPVARIARILYHIAENQSGNDKTDIEAVIFVTARPDRPDWKQTTIDWLEINEIPYHRLYMRKEDDTRADHLVKASILEEIITDGYEPVLAIDDRPTVVAMWRSYGITTMQCAPDEPGASIYAGQTLLHMIVGPAGGGKSTYVQSEYQPHEIVSTDILRMQNFGDLGHDPISLKRVWILAHGIIKARVAAGMLTVLDATNLKQEDRLRVLDNMPRGVFTRYKVIDRELGKKLETKGWRSEDLVMKHHRLFRKEEKNILAGDNHPYVTVQDLRPADSKTSR